MAMSESQIDMLATVVVKAITDRLRPLEKRLTALEGKTLKYVGTWKHGVTYAPGQIVTDGGAMWHCNYGTTARPGETSAEWTLCVKSGRV